MTRADMLETASQFQADVLASFNRLATDEMDTGIRLMMTAAATAALIEATGQPWRDYSHRGDEFWTIVRGAYAMIKTVRNQTTETRQ